MRLVDRAKNIIVNPKAEWEAIAADPTPTAQIVTGYVLPLAGLAALASLIGLSLIGQSVPFIGTYRMGIGWGLALAIYNVVMAVVFVYVVGFIIDALGPTFNAQKNMAQAIKVAAYSYTPVWVLGILTVIPALGILVIFGALYGLYLLYLGLPRLMKNPPDKSMGYTALTVVVAIVVGFVISMIGGIITAPAMLAATAAGSSAVKLDKDSTGGKLDEFAKKMEEATKKMEAAEKSGDPKKQMEAAMGALGTALSGGKGVEPVQLDALKPFVPEKFAGLPRADMRADRSGVAGLMAAKVEGVYREGNRLVREEVSKRGGTNHYSVILADRFVVSAEGKGGVDIATLKSAVNGLDLSKIESLK